MSHWEFANSYQKLISWAAPKWPDENSALAHIMVWCHQESNHYLNQCWPRSMVPYGVTRPQRGNKLSRVLIQNYLLWAIGGTQVFCMFWTPICWYISIFEDFGARSRYLRQGKVIAVGCNYIALPEIPVSGNKVLISLTLDVSRYFARSWWTFWNTSSGDLEVTRWKGTWMKETMCNREVSAVPADSRASLCVRTSANTLIAKFWLRKIRMTNWECKLGPKSYYWAILLITINGFTVADRLRLWPHGSAGVLWYHVRVGRQLVRWYCQCWRLESICHTIKSQLEDVSPRNYVCVITSM